MLVKDVKNPMHSKSEMYKMVHENAHLLRLPFEHDARKLLLAFAEIESALGKFNFRYEPAYGLQGIYYRRSQTLKDKYSEFGPLVAMSYGPWQIMYIVAVEAGFSGHPLELANGYVSLPYVIEKMNRDAKKGGTNVRLLASCYNGGNPSALFRTEAVQKYCNKLEAAYDRWLGIEINWEKVQS